MWKRQHIVLISFCGLLGTIALAFYFTAPFTWMPLPPVNATADQVIEFGNKYHTAILVDTWLQQFGTVLSVIFALSLVWLSGNFQTLAGKLTLLVSTVITSLSLAEGTFALGAVQAGENGHAQAALTCFELTNVFVHIFLLAPSLFLMLGFALKGSTVLPKFFINSAIVLGVLFQALGVVSLFNNQFIFPVIIDLNLQNIWTISVSIILLTRTKVAS